MLNSFPPDVHQDRTNTSMLNLLLQKEEFLEFGIARTEDKNSCFSHV